MAGRSTIDVITIGITMELQWNYNGITMELQSNSYQTFFNFPNFTGVRFLFSREL